jgi:hypothetical protein
MTERSKHSWRSRRRSSHSRATRPIGSDPLIAREHAAIAAAVATAVGGLLAYTIGVGVQLDGRIDRLEEDARLLLTPDGKIIPAPESIEAHYRTQALERELQVLRNRLERLEDRTRR